MTKVVLSLGSNIDRYHNIRAGLDELRATFGSVDLSPVYESEAVGFDGEPFLNLVVRVETELSVGELSDTLRAIESRHGRVRGEKKFSSRTLDIDILTYDDRVGTIEGVELPRGEILEHAFVLKPMADLMPEAKHPVEQKTYRELLAERDFSGQRLWPITFD